ncbi:amidohydrolase family protein [Rhodococcus rhodochrous]|uniref:amidohydrolase family protein n=1 Tax=Rhodococcus rhodochrous TaxID=1829 RepID=UPI000308FF37|nr:amidohydrolase family protein [Rhodococcus rhodochrous]
MSVVDSQLHVCLPDTEQSPWPKWALQFQKGGSYPSSIDRIREGMRAAGVDRGVIQVPTWFLDRDDYALESAEAYPDEFVVMLRPRLDDPQGEKRLRELAGRSVVKGVRAVFSSGAFGDQSDMSWLTDGTTDWLFATAGELRLPVMVYAPGECAAVGEIASRFPNTKLMLDHMNCQGHLSKDPEGFAGEVDQLLPLAEYPNVGVKVKVWEWQLSSNPCRFLPGHLEQMERIVTTFGPDRCFWMSDFTNFHNHSYRDLRDAFENLPFLDDAGRVQLMGQATLDWLDWP